MGFEYISELHLNPYSFWLSFKTTFNWTCTVTDMGDKKSNSHAICVHGSSRSGNGQLPPNFPLAKFLKKMKCAKNPKTNMYDCYFDYDPTKFQSRSGLYEDDTWRGNKILYGLVGAIFLLIVAFVLVYLFYLRKDPEGHGSHKKSKGPGNSLKTLKSKGSKKQSTKKSIKSSRKSRKSLKSKRKQSGKKK